MDAQELTLTGPAFDDLIVEANLVAENTAAGAEDSLVTVMAAHFNAPIRATLLATAGELGMLIRFTQTDDGALIVAQPVLGLDDKIVPNGAVQLSYRAMHGWAELAQLLPPIEAFRAPAVQGRHEDGQVIALPDPSWGEVQAGLQLRVEAWPGGARTPVAWARAWTVRDGDLFDLRLQGDRLVAVRRHIGAVAAEFEWAMAGAAATLRRVRPSAAG